MSFIEASIYGRSIMKARFCSDEEDRYRSQPASTTRRLHRWIQQSERSTPHRKPTRAGVSVSTFLVPSAAANFLKSAKWRPSRISPLDNVVAIAHSKEPRR